VPHALLHNLKHNRVLHERVVFLTAIARNVPHVDPEDMVQVTDLEEGCWQVVVRLGFQDTYDVAVIFEVMARHHTLELSVNECSFFLSRQNVVARRQGMCAGGNDLRLDAAQFILHQTFRIHLTA
jgi:KUP system potassium uptake protein